MSETPERPAGSFARVPSPELAAERYMRGIINGQLAHLLYLVQEQSKQIERLSDNLDHLHADVTAVREVLRVPRPECYPDLERKRGARRRRTTPPAAEPPSTTVQ